MASVPYSLFHYTAVQVGGLVNLGILHAREVLRIHL